MACFPASMTLFISELLAEGVAPVPLDGSTVVERDAEGHPIRLARVGFGYLFDIYILGNMTGFVPNSSFL